MSKRTAQQFRALARAYEQGTAISEFSCLSVGLEIGYEEREAYQDVFQLYVCEENEADLFTMTGVEQHNMRVLMLGFAAAMAETGDL